MQEPSYLWDVGVADLGHDVADVLEDKEPGIQAPQVELVLHVTVYDLPTPYYVLKTNKGRVGAVESSEMQRTSVQSSHAEQLSHSRESARPSVLKHLLEILILSTWTMEATQASSKLIFPF